MTQDLVEHPARPSGRVIAGYCVMGPIPTVVLAAIVGALGETGTWVLTAFECVLGLVLYMLLRPRGPGRSPWRSALGVMWLTAPLVVMASTSLPSIDMFDPSPVAPIVPPRLPEVWAALWVGCGYCACFLSAIASAIPSRQVAPPTFRGYLRFALVLGTLVTTGIVAVPTYMFLSFGAALSRSHVEANVPEPGDFDIYLQRDLNTYFSARDSSFASVRYELLRRQPTQSGVAFPKYYAWVRVRHWDRATDQGVVRLAAIDRARFEVTTWLPSEAVISQPDIVQAQFPPALLDDIQRRARAARR